MSTSSNQKMACPVHIETTPYGQHQFVIPVEKKFIWDLGGEEGDRYDVHNLHPTREIVTKLRCVCGEEVSR